MRNPKKHCTKSRTPKKRANRRRRETRDEDARHKNSGKRRAPLWSPAPAPRGLAQRAEKTKGGLLAERPDRFPSCVLHRFHGRPSWGPSILLLPSLPQTKQETGNKSAGMSIATAAHSSRTRPGSARCRRMRLITLRPPPPSLIFQACPKRGDTCIPTPRSPSLATRHYSLLPSLFIFPFFS